MRDPDYEGIVRDLNTLLEWARMRINEKGEGQFSLNVSQRHLQTKRGSAYLTTILKDLGYVKRSGGNNKFPTWWVKPEGEVSLEEFTKYKLAQKVAKTATQNPDDIAVRLVQAEAENERLRKELRKIRAQIDAVLKDQGEKS